MKKKGFVGRCALVSCPKNRQENDNKDKYDAKKGSHYYRKKIHLARPVAKHEVVLCQVQSFENDQVSHFWKLLCIQK